MSLSIEMSQLLEKEFFRLYAAKVKPILATDALFSDGTPFYRSYKKSGNGYEARLRLRTGADNAVLVTVETESGQSYPMTKVRTDRQFDYYEACLSCTGNGLRYYFKITDGTRTVYYNKRGAMKEVQEYYSFTLMPEFSTPDWAKGAVFYQIYTDRFCNGNPDNDVLDREYMYLDRSVEHVDDWYEPPKPLDVGRFYGGDLQGIMSKLDYLKDLGVDVIYLNPIFVSPSNHKYDIQDYDYIDPHLAVIEEDGGECLKEWEQSNAFASKYIRRVTDKRNLAASNRYFIKLVEEIHKRGMKIILDGVFNHCGSFNKWMDKEQIYEYEQGYEKGAYITKDSPYHSFFKFHEHSQWPYNEKYDGWWGHNTLPKLNYEESPMLEEYILKIAKKWVSPPYNADGWRLDVAADLGHSSEYNHYFWKKFRQAVKQANPEAIILAEHYGDPAAWLQGGEWDTVMNYDAFMEPVTWFLTGLEKHSDEYREDLLGNDINFRDAMSHHMSRMHYESLYVSMNELSNHDHSRFLTRTNRHVGRLATAGSKAAEEDVNKAVMRCGVVIQMTWPGAPTIYYGDEAGVCGFTDPDSRRTYPWGREDKEMIQFHKDIIAIHKAHRIFSEGSVKYLYGERNVISFGRFNLHEQAVVAVNIGSQSIDVCIPVWETGGYDGDIFKTLILTEANGYSIGGGSYTVADGCLKVNLLPQSAIVLKH